MGKNWNSKTGEWEEIKAQMDKEEADIAKKLRAQGYSVSEIAEVLPEWYQKHFKK